MMLAAGVASGQETKEPVKGNNTVLVRSDSTADYCFRKAVALISQRGFSIIHSDKEFGIATTDFKNLSKNLSGVYMRVNLAVNVIDGKTEIRFTGSYYMTGFETMIDPVAFGWGMKTSPKMITWDMLRALATDMGVGELLFLKG